MLFRSSRLIDLKTTEAATFADTLDGLSAGMCLLDADGRVVHTNLAGRLILDEGDFLSESNGRIIVRDGKTERVLRELLVAAGGGDAAIGTDGIALPLRARDGTSYVAHLLPLTSGALPERLIRQPRRCSFASRRSLLFRRRK